MSVHFFKTPIKMKFCEYTMYSTVAIVMLSSELTMFDRVKVVDAGKKDHSTKKENYCHYSTIYNVPY